MSKRANPIVIGTFVIGALALAIGLTLALGGGRLFHETTPYVLFFEGSVKGLEVGSPVMFRGVPVGTVTDIRMQIDPDGLKVEIPVFIEVDPSRISTPDGRKTRSTSPGVVHLLVRKGLRARLETKSLVTGQLLVQFDFHPGAPLEMVGTDMGVVELPTIPTPLQQIAKAFESLDLVDLARKLSKALDEVGKMLGSPEMARGVQAVPAILEQTEGLIRDLRRDITPVLRNADATLAETRALVLNLEQGTGPLGGEIKGAVADTRALMHGLEQGTGPLGAEVRGVVVDTRGLVNNVDTRVGTVADGADRVLFDSHELLTDTGQAVERVSAKVGRSLALLDETLDQAKTSLEKVDSITEGGPQLRHAVTVTLREIASAARAVRVLSDLLQQRPDALLRGKTTGGHR